VYIRWQTTRARTHARTRVVYMQRTRSFLVLFSFCWRNNVDFHFCITEEGKCQKMDCPCLLLFTSRSRLRPVGNHVAKRGLVPRRCFCKNGFNQETYRLFDQQINQHDNYFLTRQVAICRLIIHPLTSWSQTCQIDK